MGETGTNYYRRGGRYVRAGRSDKDLRSGLEDVPGLARSVLMLAAAKIDQEALVLLLVDYFLRPREICAARLEAGQLAVPGFRQPVVIAEKHITLIEDWISRPIRPRQPATVHNILSGRLRRALIEELESLEIYQHIPTPWRNDIRCGVRELRRWAEERFAILANGDEAIFRELCHSYDASLARPTYWRLTELSRRRLENAFAAEVREIEELMDSDSRAAIHRLASGHGNVEF